MNALKAKETKIWITRPYDPDVVARLAKQTGVSPLVAQALVARKTTDPEKIVLFLAPPNLSRGLYAPERLPGCADAARVLADAVRAGKKIVVYGDYYVHCITSTAVLPHLSQTVGTDGGYNLLNLLEE